MLSVNGIDLYYGAAQALRSLSLKAGIGEVTTVLGRNGVGKTSLLRAIAGHQPIRARARDRRATHSIAFEVPKPSCFRGASTQR